MFANERRNKILELLSRRSSVTVTELTGLFQVSLETIRRDLEYLEKQGALKRVHGGALSMNRMQSYTGLSERSTEHQTEKRQIARAALSHIREGERIALCDSFQELTIVTASLPIFEILSAKPGFQVILTGGFYLPGEKAFYGHLALDMIRQLQKRETHPFLRSSFSMIEGEEEFIPYPSMKKEKAKNQKERGEAR